MFPVPSIGLAELVILAGIAGLVMLIMAIIVVAVVRNRKRSDIHRPAGAGRHGLGDTAKKPRDLWKWIVILALIVLIALPLFVVLFAGLLVIPVKQRISTPASGIEPTIQAAEVWVVPAATMPPALAGSDATPTSLLWSASMPEAPTADASQPTSASAESTHGGFSLLPLNPDNTFAWSVILPGIAGLVLLTCAAVVAPIVRNWGGDGLRLKDTRVNGDNEGRRARKAKLRYGFLAFALWFALSGFLILDLGFSVSLYFRFVAIYTAFWVLVGALLLYGRPVREKLLILALFAIVLFSVRFIDWTSRKPFLKDLYHIDEGMTEAQVDRIMGDWMKGISNAAKVNELGKIVTGTVYCGHTTEGWGDSDFGELTFEDGRVVEVRFLPD